MLQNPRCGDLDGIPSLPANAYALLRQKFRPTTSTLTAAADSKDRTTTKLLIRLQVIWLECATGAGTNVGVQHANAIHGHFGDYAELGILVSLIISLVIFTFGRRVSVHQQLVLGDFELMELVLVCLLRCIQIGMECRTCTIVFPMFLEK